MSPLLTLISTPLRSSKEGASCQDIQDVLLDSLTSDAVLEEAYAWLCVQRLEAKNNSDVWCLRSQWALFKAKLKVSLRAGSYRFSPVRCYMIKGDTIDHWNAQDALVQKALDLVISPLLNPLLPEHCYHLKGRGGLKAAIRRAQENLAPGILFMRTDVYHFYASINRSILISQLSALIPDAVLLKLMGGFIHHLVDKDGVLIDKKRGIARGSSLSPLLGPVYLMPVAKAMDKLKVTCTIFMDDVCLQVPTRWKLRKAIKRLNEVFDTLKIKKHPDKTEIGHVEKGFNFLSYRFLLSGLSVAQIALDRFSAKVTQLDEQRADSPARERYWRQFTYWIFQDSSHCSARPLGVMPRKKE